MILLAEAICAQTRIHAKILAICIFEVYEVIYMLFTVVALLALMAYIIYHEVGLHSRLTNVLSGCRAALGCR